MRRECRKRFSRPRLQRKSLVSDPGVHHGTCVTHVPWCMSGLLTLGGGKKFPAFPAHAQPTILRIRQEAHCHLPLKWHTPTKQCETRLTHIVLKKVRNSLAPRRCSNSESVIFRCRWWIKLMSISVKLSWMQQSPLADKSRLVQVIAWYHQATSHYLS